MSTLNPKLCSFLLYYFSFHAAKPVRQKDLILYNISVIMTFVPIKLADLLYSHATAEYVFTIHSLSLPLIPHWGLY